MSEIFKKRMNLTGGTVSKSIRIQSNEIMDKTFSNDLGYRLCKLYSRNMELLEDSIEIKYQFSQTYTVNKDQVEYLAQFRPGYHPEKKYMDNDGVERLGFYLEIPDENTGINEMWLIVGKNDKNSFIRYNILKCNWTFKWIKNNKIYSCLGILRNRNNYNSGVWSDGFFTSVDNQTQFIIPSTLDTQTIDYNDRFMISDSSIRPLVYEVSKIEDTFPCGTIKITLKQDHYNEHLDNVELKICNYYDYPMKPETPVENQYKLIYFGTSPIIYMGKSKRVISLFSEEIIDFTPIWKYSIGDNLYATKETIENFIINENDKSITIKANVFIDNLGKIFKVSCFNGDILLCELELEVKL